MLKPCHVFVLVVVMLAVVLTGCAAGVNPGGCATNGCGGPTATAFIASSPVICATAACAASHLQVFVEPDAGEAPIVHAIQTATRSVWVEVYILTDRNVVHALEDAAGRGVDVRVLLEPHPFGGGDVAAQQVMEELNAAGAQARPSDPAYHYTHEKALVVDGATAYILTCNLSKSGLGGSSAGANREYGVIDADAADVNEVTAIFQADWNAVPVRVNDPRLVVSPLNARSSLAALIAGAHSTLLVEDEEMYDTASENALIAAAHRGVTVEVLLPPPSGSSSYGADVARLQQGGVHVRFVSVPYMHAKLIVADGALAFTGSENFSSTSLDENRELGIVLADPAALATLTHTFTQDWALAVAA
ncbi:MAG: phospholipase D-like domain-containing protein [Ktedonobacterales bacterium]